MIQSTEFYLENILLQCYQIHLFLKIRYVNIKPVLKDGSICRTKYDNYRPVLNSSIFFKLFDYSLGPILKQNLIITPLKFEFITGSSCDMAITFFLINILPHKKNQSNVHCTSIDISKAFDELNITIPIDKLPNTNLPTLINNITYNE